MPEHGDGSHWEDPNPNANVSACVDTAASSSECLPYHNTMEWANTADCEANRASGFHSLNELDKAKQCVLWVTNKIFYL